jgi:hypothetical protein
MYKKKLSQDKAVAVIRHKIDAILTRPGMYVTTHDNGEGFYYFITAYVDALAIVYSGYMGLFTYGEVQRPDPAKSWQENVAAITKDVRAILDTPVKDIEAE